MRIGIDIMGGDHPPESLFPAILKAIEQLSDHHFVVLATQQVLHQLKSYLLHSISHQEKISFEKCEDVISMTDHPLSAVRHKKLSSLVLGIHLLKDKKIDAFVSCGNTGALIACAAIYLPLFSGITHPALLANLPTVKGQVTVLDVGGSVLNKAENLVRFAFLGAAYQKTTNSIERPNVGLLNVGEEFGKGTAEVKQAYEILTTYSKDGPCFNFMGNVEGRDLFKGDVDVLVTDGFTGNVLLKTAEGIATLIFDTLQEKMREGSKQFKNEFEEVRQRFDYAMYPGAIVCGVDTTVVKVHGNATANSLFRSIVLAIECLEKEVISKIKEQDRI